MTATLSASDTPAVPTADRPVRPRWELPCLAVLVAANALATVVRFVLFRSWVFRPRTQISEIPA